MVEQNVVNNLLQDEEAQQALAEKVGLRICHDLHLKLEREFYKKIPYSFVKKHRILPVEFQNEELIVAVSDPIAIEPLEELRFMLDCPIKAIYTPRSTLQEAIHECYDRQAGEASQLIANMKTNDGNQGAGTTHDLLDDTKQPALVKLLNLIITEAIQQGASDIHFEPFEGGLRVRYRIDGVLQNRHTPAPELQSQLIARIKVMAKLDIAEHRLPQDGRIKLRMGQREIDFRVSTVPVAGGERIVLRILDKGNITLGLDKIGMPQEVLMAFKRLIELPEGIFLVTGPTGSGKTTTLYSAIHEQNGEDINIMTIEDPVEYNLKGIAQIAVNPKIDLDFSKGLRHILRQDPDMVLVGEIRDPETATIAIQAALTGHLVLSTLHTNDAPSAVTRLVDMGTEPYLLSSTIVGVLAQRLVRRICPDCKTKDGEHFRGKGCSTCYQTGYKGRLALYELMEVNHRIKQQIAKSADAVALRELALESGMQSLYTHGLELVKQGETTLSEVMRVARECEE